MRISFSLHDAQTEHGGLSISDIKALAATSIQSHVRRHLAKRLFSSLKVCRDDITFPDMTHQPSDQSLRKASADAEKAEKLQQQFLLNESLKTQTSQPSTQADGSEELEEREQEQEHEEEQEQQEELEEYEEQNGNMVAVEPQSEGLMQSEAPTAAVATERNVVQNIATQVATNYVAQENRADEEEDEEDEEDEEEDGDEDEEEEDEEASDEEEEDDDLDAELGIRNDDGGEGLEVTPDMLEKLHLEHAAQRIQPALITPLPLEPESFPSAIDTLIAEKEIQHQSAPISLSNAPIVSLVEELFISSLPAHAPRPPQITQSFAK